MWKMAIKFLTHLALIVAISFSPSGLSNILSQKYFKNHMRWGIQGPRTKFTISTNLKNLKIKTFNKEFYEKLRKDLSSIKLSEKYIKNIKSDTTGYPESPMTFDIELISSDVEVFHFYKKSENKYVIDFWKDLKKEENKTLKQIEKKSKVLRPKVAPVKVAKKKIRKKVKKNKEAVETQYIHSFKKSKKFRDFRYGSSLIWDYRPLSPTIGQFLNSKSKTPEYFYPLKDREFEKDEVEAHMQLSINLFRSKKWGLMYRSIKLFETKYKDINTYEDYRHLNEYMKACSILKKNIHNMDEGPKKLAIKILDGLSQVVVKYDFKSSILKYLIQYGLEKENMIEVLKYSKSLYIESSANFDRELSQYAAKVILFSLAKLNQIEKINEFIEDKKIRKLLSSHTQIGYQSFVLLKKNKYEEFIRIFDRKKRGLVRPYSASILYNLGESYFRNADYKNAIKYFDSFISAHSYHSFSSYARLRIAQAYDIQEKNPREVLSLYKNAMDKSSIAKAKIEARIRYVGYRVARNRFIEKEDLETEVFLDRKEDEKNKLTENIKRLLWLTRLRVLISTKRYQDALEYLSAIPVVKMKATERRLFEGDGAEIAFGLIKNYFEKERFTKAVQIWEIYKNKYTNKVAQDPYANFIVAKSYLRLGLYENFNKVVKNLESLSARPMRTFPIWVDRENLYGPKVLSSELKILHDFKNKRWDTVSVYVSAIEKKNKNYIKGKFYLGIAKFSEKKYGDAIKHFEDFLRIDNSTSNLSRNEVAELFTAYLDSLYKDNKFKKFKESSVAILNDLKKSKSVDDSTSKLKERISYLLIEILSGEDNPKSYLEVESLGKKFSDEFEKSQYRSRVSYLLGVALIKNKSKLEGKKLLNQLINNEKVPEHIKELCKSELSSLRISERNL